MSGVFVHGIGAVSPAGWDVHSFRDVLAKGEPIPARNLPRPGWSSALRVRGTPALAARSGALAHARLRRASPITQFTVAAAVAALGEDAARVSDGSLRLGIILCVMAGCVNYSRRFYEETLRDPATASPVVFPETVFNAPASHLGALLGASALNYTLVGDPGMFLVGLSLAGDWLRQQSVDGCLVVGSEEIDWLVADAFRRFERRAILAEGAGALYLKGVRDAAKAIELERVTDAHSFARDRSRRPAAQAMRSELPPSREDHLLCDGTQGLPKLDAAEFAAWSNWRGGRLSVKPILGEGLAAASAWQCVAAVEALRQEAYAAASVSVVGCNQQAIGAHFVKAV